MSRICIMSSSSSKKPLTEYGIQYDISANLAHINKQLLDKPKSAVKMNSSTRELFRKTTEVEQECRLQPTLFNIFLEWIMSDALEEP